MAGSDVEIGGAVDEEDGHIDAGSGGERIDGGQVHAVPEASPENAGFNHRTPEPSQGGEELGDAIPTDLAKAGEGTFGDGGLYLRFPGEFLEEDGGAHGQTDRVDAAGAFLASGKPFDPAAQVVALAPAVGNKFAATFTVTPRIRAEDSETGKREIADEARHLKALAADAVLQQNAMPRLRCGARKEAGDERGAVTGGDGDAFGASGNFGIHGTTSNEAIRTAQGGFD